MEQGFTFHWEAGKNPIMTNPEGLVVELAVEKNIPYLRAGSEFSQPRDARESKVVPISTMIVEDEPCLGTQEEEDEEDRLADIVEDWENVRQHVQENKGNPDASDVEFGPEEDGSDDEGDDDDGSDDDAVAPEVPPFVRVRMNA